MVLVSHDTRAPWAARAGFPHQCREVGCPGNVMVLVSGVVIVMAMGLTMILAVAMASSVALAVAVALTVREITVATSSPARAGRVGRGGVSNRRCGVVGVGMVVAAVVAAMFGEKVVHGEFKVQGLGNARDATEVDADIKQVGQARPATAEPPVAAAAKAESHGTARVATVLGLSAGERR